MKTKTSLNFFFKPSLALALTAILLIGCGKDDDTSNSGKTNNDPEPPQYQESYFHFKKDGVQVEDAKVSIDLHTLGGDKVTFTATDDYFNPTYQLSIRVKTDQFNGTHEIGETLDARAKYTDIEYGENSAVIKTRYDAVEGTLKLMNMENGNTEQDKFYQGEFSGTFIHIYMNENYDIDTLTTEITDAKFLVDLRDE